MGFIGRAIRRGVSDAVGKAVGNAVGSAVRQAVEPAAANLANQAAESINQATGANSQTTASNDSGLQSAMFNLERSMQGYATKAAANMKICPNCEKPASADKTFCPECGAKLPDTTLAQGAVCPKCGKQNDISTKFCQDCGEKLPIAIQEEQKALNRMATVLEEWDSKLPQYPKWNCGGSEYNIEVLESGIMFCADFNGNSTAARQAVTNYRILLQENGFKIAGQYPDVSHLYKMINGVCYHVDTEHCFEGDADCPAIYFDINEPYGGYNYVKPEQKVTSSLKDLFGF